MRLPVSLTVLQALVPLLVEVDVAAPTEPPRLAHRPLRCYEIEENARAADYIASGIGRLQVGRTRRALRRSISSARRSPAQSQGGRHRWAQLGSTSGRVPRHATPRRVQKARPIQQQFVRLFGLSVIPLATIVLRLSVIPLATIISQSPNRTPRRSARACQVQSRCRIGPTVWPMCS